VPKNITIYTTNNCAYCGMVKKFLTMKGHNYEEVNIEQDPTRQKEAMEASGALTVPVTIITKQDGTKDVTVGFNAGRLAASLA
jgi:glutaredoxin